MGGPAGVKQGTWVWQEPCPGPGCGYSGQLYSKSRPLPFAAQPQACRLFHTPCLLPKHLLWACWQRGQRAARRLTIAGLCLSVLPQRGGVVGAPAGDGDRLAHDVVSDGADEGGVLLAQAIQQNIQVGHGSTGDPHIPQIVIHKL